MNMLLCVFLQQGGKRFLRSCGCYFKLLKVSCPFFYIECRRISASHFEARYDYRLIIREVKKIKYVRILTYVISSVRDSYLTHTVIEKRNARHLLTILPD